MVVLVWALTGFLRPLVAAAIMLQNNLCRLQKVLSLTDVAPIDLLWNSGF